MWIHYTQPEIETIDCVFCKVHEHYSWRNPDKKKRGQPIVEGRNYVKRREPIKGNCPGCPIEKRWTLDNYEIYKKWCLSKDGFDVGEIDKETLERFFTLTESNRMIHWFQTENAFINAMVRLNG